MPIGDKPHHLPIITVNTVTNPFEFNISYEYGFITYGSSADCDLTTEDSSSWQQFNVATLGNYAPPQANVGFEFGASSITVIPGAGGALSETNYDLNFGSNPIVQSTDLVFAQAEDTIIKFYETDTIAMFNGSSFEFELTTDRNVLNNNIHVAGVATGSTVKQNPVQSSTLPSFDLTVDSSTRFVDGELEFIFNDVLEYRVPFLAPQLIDSGSNVDVSLTTIKNINYNIDICPTDLNPDLNIEDHNFVSVPDYLEKLCDVFDFTAYHGASGESTLLADLLLNDLEPSHGSYGDLELSATHHFTLDFVHGSYSKVNTFTDNPVVVFDGDADHGSYSDFDLTTIAVISEVDSYGGAYGDLDFSDFPAAELDPIAYNGALADVEILTEPVITDIDAHGGSYGDTDLTSFPQIEFIVDAYAGSYADSDVTPSVVFISDSYGGGYGDLELDTSPSEGISIDAYHGGDGVLDLAYTPTFEAIGYHGGDVTPILLNVTLTMEADGYHGGYVDTDYSPNPPDELDIDAHHGSSGEFELSLTKALFPRAYNGSYADSDLEISPSEGITIDAYHGADGVFATLDETEFNFTAYHGSSIDDLIVAVTVNFPVDVIEHGSYVETDELKRATTLEVDVYHGANGVLSNFVVPQGQTIDLNFYNGAVFDATLRTFEVKYLTPMPIVASTAMYDGMGGVGGLNHCPVSTADLDPYMGDNVTRLGYDPLHIEDQLIVRFDDIGDDPWTTCSGGGIKFDVGFQTQPRFEADAYAGEHTEMFIPIKLMALAGEDVPVERLYHFEYWAIVNHPTFEMEPIEVVSTGVLWDQPDDFVAFGDAATFSLTLTPTAFGQFYHGISANADFVVPRPAWLNALPPAVTGETFHFAFEPVEYTRFCKGYIVPNGSAVVFEFDLDNEDYDCDKWVGGAGEHMDLVLSDFFQPQASINGGERLSFALIIDPEWELYARHDSDIFCQMYSEPEFEPEFVDGSNVDVTFYEPPVDAYTGEYMEFDLQIPGPAVAWVTDSDCLPNQYIPLTPDGDPDLVAMTPDDHGTLLYPPVPVEFKPYLTRLLATCITFVDSQGED